MDRDKVNKAYVAGTSEMFKKHKCRFVLALMLDDDGHVNCLKNIHTITENEFLQTLLTFAESYPEYLEYFRTKAK